MKKQSDFKSDGVQEGTLENILLKAFHINKLILNAEMLNFIFTAKYQPFLFKIYISTLSAREKSLMDRLDLNLFAAGSQEEQVKTFLHHIGCLNIAMREEAKEELEEKKLPATSKHIENEINTIITKESHDIRTDLEVYESFIDDLQTKLQTGQDFETDFYNFYLVKALIDAPKVMDKLLKPSILDDLQALAKHFGIWSHPVTQGPQSQPQAGVSSSAAATKPPENIRSHAAPKK